MRRVALALLVVLLAGCGSAVEAPGPEGGAGVAPRSSALLVRLDSRLDPAQRKAVDSLLRLLPVPTGVQRALVSARAALGPESDLVALTAEDLQAGRLLALAQPRNRARLETVLAQDGLVAEEVRAWRVIARDRATIDRFKVARNGGSLAGDEAYREATRDLAVDALARVYLDGAAATASIGMHTKTGDGPVPGLGRIAWLSAAVRARQSRLSVELRLKADEIEAAQYAPELPAEVPAGAVLFVDAKGLDAVLDELRRSPALAARLGPVRKALGGLLDEAIDLFEREAAFYVRPTHAGPEATMVVKVADEQSARAVLGRLATLAGAVGQRLREPLRIAGVPTTKLVVGKTALYYAVFEGKLVISNAATGIRGLAATTPRLAGSAAWRAATVSAALPGETAGIVYVDAPRAGPLLARLAKTTQSLRNPPPFGTALLYGSVKGSVLSVKGFVSVR